MSESESGKRNATAWRRDETLHSATTAHEAYEVAKHRALALLDVGFYLGGRIEARRAELHEREGNVEP